MQDTQCASSNCSQVAGTPMMESTLTTSNSLYNPSYSPPSCPNCGYCPHCGRSNKSRDIPYYPYTPPIWTNTPTGPFPNTVYCANGAEQSLGNRPESVDADIKKMFNLT